MKSTLYQDYDALAYRPHKLGEERGAINHVKKAKARQKGLEITFDPEAHREFISGFRKRKQQRRKEANKQLERKAKQQRVVDRAERRKEMKQQLRLPEDYGIQDSDSEPDAAAVEAAAAKAEVKQYQQGTFTTTVSITALNPGYSSDEDDADAAAADGEEGHAASDDDGHPAPAQHVRPPQRHKQRGHGGVKKGSKALHSSKRGRVGLKQRSATKGGSNSKKRK